MTTVRPDDSTTERAAARTVRARRSLALALFVFALAPWFTACGSGAVTGAVVGAAVGAAIGSDFDDDGCYYDDCYYYKSGDPALTSSF